MELMGAFKKELSLPMLLAEARKGTLVRAPRLGTAVVRMGGVDQPPPTAVLAANPSMEVALARAPQNLLLLLQHPHPWH